MSLRHSAPKDFDREEVRSWLESARVTIGCSPFFESEPDTRALALRICDTLQETLEPINRVALIHRVVGPRPSPLAFLSSEDARSPVGAREPKPSEGERVLFLTAWLCDLLWMAQLQDQGFLSDALKERRRVAAIPTKEVEDARKNLLYHQLIAEGRRSMEAKRIISERSDCSVKAVENALRRHRLRTARN